MISFLKKDQNILFLLTSAHWGIQSQLTDEFKRKGYNVSPEQWQLMLLIQMEGPCYQQKLADIQQKDKAAIKRLLDRLEKKGMVKRKKSKTDLRKKKIYLTKKGDKITFELNAIADKTFLEVGNDLSEIELNALKRLISRLKRK